jgi:hypothetical protein
VDKSCPQKFDKAVKSPENAIFEFLQSIITVGYRNKNKQIRLFTGPSSLIKFRNGTVIFAIFRITLVMTAVLFIAVPPAVAMTEVRTERVQFDKGANSAVIESSITGYDSVDYMLNAKKGQYMNVSMATDNTANYFNILAPGEKNVAIFNGSISENQFEGILPESGDYKIRVYLMRSASRRNETAKYRLEMIITESGGKVSTSAGVQ